MRGPGRWTVKTLAGDGNRSMTQEPLALHLQPKVVKA